MCSAGAGVTRGWDLVSSGRDGLSPLAVLDSGLPHAPLCAQVPDGALTLAGPQPANRTLACAVVAGAEAARALKGRRESVRLGLVVGTTVAGMCRSEAFYRSLLADQSLVSRAAVELRRHDPSAITAALAEVLGAQVALTVSTACSAGLHAVGMAARLIERGRCDVCCALGADALSVLTIRGFASLVLLAPGGCAPFSRDRAGISLGEGAGALLLASPEAAKALGAAPLAYLAGWGASADCHHMTAPHPEGRGAAAAVRAALAHAGLPPSDIDLVAAHGTGTPDNDLAEAKALRDVFGPDIPPFCSMKRSLGHTLGASGALEAVFTVMAIREGRVPPTAGFAARDEAIGMAPSPGAKRRIRAALKNAFGFGGNNAAVVLTEAA